MDTAPHHDTSDDALREQHAEPQPETRESA
jgi:hypothetical protein